MKFELDYKILVNEEPIDSISLSKDIQKYSSTLAGHIGTAQGVVRVRLDEEIFGDDFHEPIVRLADLWVRKLPWILGGDTETVAFRNSEHCYAFVPTGESVEFSLFAGSENEIEDYVVEPVIIRLEQFVIQVLRFCDDLIKVIQQLDPTSFEKDEDCRDFLASVEEAKKAWRDHKLHQRR